MKYNEPVKPIAIVLPQFHPTVENNEWWGKGFTEWTNVVKGVPRFKGHYQPHLPQDLGFYDLRLPETRKAQADLAAKYGIYGFCYYHYWFNERRILEEPVDAILESGEPQFPFMLCWANENWTRNWDGGYEKVLLEQKYSLQDFVEHARHLVSYFKDKRYIRVNGRPVFSIYKDKEIPNLKEGLDAFRGELRNSGIDVYLCRFERRIGTSEDSDKAYSIFDAGIEFQPLTKQFGSFTHTNTRHRQISYYFNPGRYYRWACRKIFGRAMLADLRIPYIKVVENDLECDFQNKYPIFPGVSPGWDNSARRTKSSALILYDSTPELFKQWIKGKIRITDWTLVPEKFLFINAWNEWAEGNHLEPCERWGSLYLEAVQQALEEDNVD